MADENHRPDQLKHIANKDLHEMNYGQLAKGELSLSPSQSGPHHMIPVPTTLKAQLGSPVWLHLL